jgi:CcmD family protein
MRDIAHDVVTRLKYVLLAALVLALPAVAMAQNYQAVPSEGRVRESIPAAPFLAGAYAFIWLCILVYVAVVARRLARVQGDLEELRRRVERDSPR